MRPQIRKPSAATRLNAARFSAALSGAMLLACLLAAPARSYDELMPRFSDDGKFAPKALAVLAKSYVELGVLPQEPDMRPSTSKLYTEAFLPKNE